VDQNLFFLSICPISQCPSDSDTEITMCSFITWREFVQEAYIQALLISCAMRRREEQSFDLRLESITPLSHPIWQAVSCCQHTKCWRVLPQAWRM